MTSFFRFAIAILTMTFTIGIAQTTSSDLAPNHLVQQSAFIAIGTFQFNNGQCVFTATESLKGDSTVGVPTTVTIPIEAGFAAWLQQAVALTPTILVGTYSAANGEITLPHAKHSVWPQGTFPDYFADKTVEGCKDFIVKAHLD